MGQHCHGTRAGRRWGWGRLRASLSGCVSTRPLARWPPSTIPLSASVDSFAWRFWELTVCGIEAQAPRATPRANLTILSNVSNLGILSCPVRLLAERKLRTRGWAKAGRMPVPTLCLSPPPGWTFRGNAKTRVTCGKGV